jgi:hypothetical protein
VVSTRVSRFSSPSTRSTRNRRYIYSPPDPHYIWLIFSRSSRNMSGGLSRSRDSLNYNLSYLNVSYPSSPQI